MTDLSNLTIDDLIPLLEGIATNPDATDSNKSFADSLVNGKWGYRKRGYLTDNQFQAARKMVDRLINKPEPKRTVELASVHTFLKNAKRFLKYPKVNLQFADGTPVKLYISGDKSKFPDTLNVKVNESWYGRIFDSGEWHQPRAVNPERVVELETLLKTLAADPAGVAAAYGHLTGNCCFCMRKLSDERSLDVGFGPVCADHFDLKEQWKKGEGAKAHAMHVLRQANPHAGRRMRVAHK